MSWHRYDNFNTDDKDWCELAEDKDFLTYKQKELDYYKPTLKMQKFLEHGMQIADNIVYLTTINHYTTKRRIRDMREAGFALKEIYNVPTPKNPGCCSINVDGMTSRLPTQHVTANY